MKFYLKIPLFHLVIENIMKNAKYYDFLKK